VNELTADEVRQVKQAILDEAKARPPAIGVIGVSGTGKSSTINAMFKTSLAISHTRACTKEFLTTELELRMTKGAAENETVSLVVVDAPGLGEDIHSDPTYIEMYRQNLPHCDVILWLMTARNRAVCLDQQYLQDFESYHRRIVFAVNQVDLVHPLDWNPASPVPSVEMERNIRDIVDDRADKLGSVLGFRPNVIGFSAERGYNLEELFASLIAATSESRKFLFDFLKNFSYQDFVPTQSRKELRRR